MRNDIARHIEDLSKVAKEADCLQELNNNLLLDLKDKGSEIENLSLEINAFEDRVVILIKERKNLKEIVKTYYSL